MFFFFFFFLFRKLRGYLSFLGKVGMNMNQSEVVSYYEAFVGKISEMANVNMGWLVAGGVGNLGWDEIRHPSPSKLFFFSFPQFLFPFLSLFFFLGFWASMLKPGFAVFFFFLWSPVPTNWIKKRNVRLKLLDSLCSLFSLKIYWVPTYGGGDKVLPSLRRHYDFYYNNWILRILR